MRQNEEFKTLNFWHEKSFVQTLEGAFNDDNDDDNNYDEDGDTNDDDEDDDDDGDSGDGHTRFDA